MTANRARDLPVVLAAVLVVLVTLAGCGASRAVAPAVGPDGVQRIEVTVSGGTVAGGVARYAVPLGSTVDLVVASDTADEVHLHGYDRSSFVTAGATTSLRFVADVPGVFEVELEQRGEQLAQLEVS